MQALTDTNFDINSSRAFRNLWKNEAFTDVTLVSMDGQDFKAHKVILSSSSNFFNHVFLRNSQPNLVLYLKGINYQQLEQIMEFIYNGQCEVNEEELHSFMETAIELKIEKLINYEKTGIHVKTQNSCETYEEIRKKN